MFELSAWGAFEPSSSLFEVFGSETFGLWSLFLVSKSLFDESLLLILLSFCFAFATLEHEASTNGAKMLSQGPKAKINFLLFFSQFPHL
ncbi:hypothetical protein [Mycoplasmopsis pulmonis]|uniref:hypothetical protein n=1 Tax=Mycoplasmopsis pulmonis TaxID=2107 RepID=UPI00059DBE5B|nr:hypothetical protein [Mycoplasmopsis pulmonis]